MPDWTPVIYSYTFAGRRGSFTLFVSLAKGYWGYQGVCAECADDMDFIVGFETRAAAIAHAESSPTVCEECQITNADDMELPEPPQEDVGG